MLPSLFSPPYFAIRNSSGALLVESPHFARKLSQVHDQDVEAFLSFLNALKIDRFKSLRLRRKYKDAEGYCSLSTFLFWVDLGEGLILEVARPFSQINEVHQNCMITLDAHFKIQSLSSSAKKYFKYKDITGLYFNDLFDFDVLARFEQVLKQAGCDIFELFDERTGYELRFNVYSDGSQIVLIFNTLSLRPDFVKDLKDYKTQLQAVLENSNDAFVLASLDFRVMSFNKSFEQYIKNFLHKQPFVGDDLREFIEPAALEGFYKNFSLASQGETVKTERILLNIWFEINYYPVYVEGEMIGVSISFTNIDQRKQYEFKLKLQNQKLAEIAQFQSHNVRRPLANILGLTQLIPTLEDADELRLTIGYLEQSAQSLDEVIQSIVYQANILSDDE